MKYILPLILLCVGCASTVAPVSPEPKAPVCPTPIVTHSPPPCADQLKLLDSDELAKGYSCPDNSRTTFPSYYPNNGKVLVLCQCK